MNSFVCFLEEIDHSKKPFRNYMTFRVNTIFHIIGKSVQIKVELLMELVHLGLESAVFVSKTIA